MKKLILFLSIIIIQSCECGVCEYKFIIEYPVGRHSARDYTNSVKTLPNGCVEYLNWGYSKTIRCGTYSIEENYQYKK